MHCLGSKELSEPTRWEPTIPGSSGSCRAEMNASASLRLSFLGHNMWLILHRPHGWVKPCNIWQAVGSPINESSFFQAAALWREGEKPVKPVGPGTLLVLRLLWKADGIATGLALNLGKGDGVAVARMGALWKHRVHAPCPVVGPPHPILVPSALRSPLPPTASASHLSATGEEGEGQVLE